MNIQKDIKDFHMHENLISIPENFSQEHLLSQMFQFALWADTGYSFMKHRFSLQAILWLKKTQAWLSAEYYFYKDEQKIEDFLSHFSFTDRSDFSDFKYYGFTVELDPWETSIQELNICDLDKAYVVKWDDIIRKNIYFFFPKTDMAEIVKCIKNTIYPLSTQDIWSLLKWIQYQDELWEVVIWKKRQSETVYMTRLSFQGFLLFCKEFWWDVEIWKFIHQHKEALGYYVFDIWIEYSFHQWKLSILKTSIYGLL